MSKETKISIIILIMICFIGLITISGIFFNDYKEKSNKIKKGQYYLEKFQNHRGTDIINAYYPKIYNNDMDIEYLSGLTLNKKIESVSLYMANNYFSFNIEMKLDNNSTRKWSVKKYKNKQKKEFISEVYKILQKIEILLNEDK